VLGEGGSKRARLAVHLEPSMAGITVETRRREGNRGGPERGKRLRPVHHEEGRAEGQVPWCTEREAHRPWPWTHHEPILHEPRPSKSPSWRHGSTAARHVSGPRPAQPGPSPALTRPAGAQTGPGQPLTVDWGPPVSLSVHGPHMSMTLFTTANHKLPCVSPWIFDPFSFL
jgi:hypothetical protein